jgi:hypothetical protein
MSRNENLSRYTPEFALIGATLAISVLGFWKLYFGLDADPQPHHHLHALTSFGWTLLLLIQLWIIAKGNRTLHRTNGLVVLIAGPLLVATTAMLSVYSASKGVMSGEGDMLFVQNVMTTIWLALLIVLAFALRKNRRVHAALLMATTILFMGIALFFAMISFFPPFRIEGPDTFYRFGQAAMTGQLVCIVIGLGFFLRDRRNGWPYLLAGFAHSLNEGIRMILEAAGLIDPLTATVGAIGQPLAFTATFAIIGVALYATVLPLGLRARRA